MTASQRRTVTVVVAALGVAFLLVWAATSGPPQLVVPQTDSVAAQPDQPRPDEVDHGTEPGRRTTHDSQPFRTTTVGDWFQDLAAFAIVFASLLMGGLLLRQLLLRIRRGVTDELLVVPLEPLPDLDRARAAVSGDRERQREALAASDVRNGIIACWVVFEEAAAASHVVKLPAETASAFVVRFLHSLDVDPRPVGELARLFLEARFSTHPMPADARPRAERALSAIHQDLAVAGVAP